MEENHNDFNYKQSNQKPNQESIVTNSYSQRDNLSMDIEDTEERTVATTFQRKPQFRFNENNKRRFS